MAKKLYEDILLMETALLDLKGNIAMFERMVELGCKESDVQQAYQNCRDGFEKIKTQVANLNLRVFMSYKYFHAEADTIAIYG